MILRSPMSTRKNHHHQTPTRTRLCVGASSSMGDAGATRPMEVIVAFYMTLLQGKPWTRSDQRWHALSLDDAGTWERDSVCFATRMIHILTGPPRRRRRGRNRMIIRSGLPAPKELTGKGPKRREGGGRQKQKIHVIKRWIADLVMKRGAPSPFVECVSRCRRFQKTPRTGPATRCCQVVTTSSASNASGNGGQPTNQPMMMVLPGKQHSTKHWSSAARRVGVHLVFVSHPTNATRARQRRR